MCFVLDEAVVCRLIIVELLDGEMRREQRESKYHLRLTPTDAQQPIMTVGGKGSPLLSAH